MSKWAKIEFVRGHNLYLYTFTWISKLFCTVVFEKEKCHSKPLFKKVEGQGHT